MMNLKRVLAISFSLTMLLWMMPAGTSVHAEETRNLTSPQRVPRPSAKPGI